MPLGNIPPGDPTDLLTRLAAHRTVGNVPRAELEWLVAHGTLERFEPGHVLARKGEIVDTLRIILTGKVSYVTDQGGVWRKVVDWREGDVTGLLPFSRLTTSPGNARVDEPSELLRVDKPDVALMPTECPHVTAALVHVMLDRARVFTSSDLQVEKMASLGKLAAGLAHELNNPASAAVRSARLLAETLGQADGAARALHTAHLDDRELAQIDGLRERCLATPGPRGLSPVERSDREESIASWLTNHSADEALAPGLAEADVRLDSLEELASAMSGAKLDAALHWLAVGCTMRGLVRDIERAASRVHTLVSAVKGFTYMDHAAVPEPADVAQGLSDTVAILAAKAREKSASVTLEVPPDLPRVRAFGGELNQVWANLLDNALDAVHTGGHVRVTARADQTRVVVRVTDDGPGIPVEVRKRIFDPFFTTKPVGKGTGLGLDIVRRLVDRNEGLIDVESEPGRTEFRVALPVAR